MTTLSITVTLLPIAVGIQIGSELLRATAIVLMGGLTTSTLLTLVFVPAMYTIFDDIESWVMRGIHRVARPRQLEPEELAILHGVAAHQQRSVANPASTDHQPESVHQNGRQRVAPKAAER